MKKRILIITESLSGGGLERVVIEQSKGFIKNSYEVHIIILENMIEYNLPKEINIHIVNKENKKVISQIRPYYYAYKIKKILKNFGQFDLTLSHLGSLRAVKILDIVDFDNLYSFIHNIQSKRRFHRHNGKKIKTWFKKLNIQNSYKNKNIICVSKGVEDDTINVMNIKPKTIQTIYNPFDFDEIRRLSNEINQQIPKEDYIIHVGRFEMKYKRHDILLKAYKEADIDEKLVLLGQGRDEGKIKELINRLELNNKVILAGFHSNPYPWISNAKLFVFSSDHEGFGNVLVEALILKTPVVSTNYVSAASEIMVEELSDFLVDVQDYKALSKKIKEALVKYPKIKDKLIEKFNINHIMRQYDLLMEN